MKKCICAVILLSLSICAFAANGNINLLTPAKLNGTQLGAGDYKLSWEGPGNNVQVSVVGKGVKLTVPATIIANQSNLQDSVVKNGDGTIQEIHFSGKKTIVKFN
jgi:hypothetical protein